MRTALVGCRLVGVTTRDAERAGGLSFATGDRRHQLVFELFGPRGLWALTDPDLRVQELSRLPTGARALRRGDQYQWPAPRAAFSDDQPARFEAPLLLAVDRYYSEIDDTARAQAQLQACDRALARATKALHSKRQALTAEATAIARAGEIRSQADLLLSYGFSAPPGAKTLTVPDPSGGDAHLEIKLKPGQSIQDQAAALYRRAGKLERSAASLAQREAELAAIEQQLATVVDQRQSHLEPTVDELQSWTDAALAIAHPPTTARAKAAKGKTQAAGPRKFVSTEGYPILVGRSSQQNQQLSLRIARGNDLWLHVGGGRTGSHVVIRLPKGKTASLPTLIEAGMLAVHFSKSRGADRCEVIYTQAKHVRRPKGAPVGSVIAAHTKSLTIDEDPERLRQVLATSTS